MVLRRFRVGQGNQLHVIVGIFTGSSVLSKKGNNRNQNYFSWGGGTKKP